MSIHCFRPSRLTCSKSLGRGPNVSRLRAWRIFWSLEIVGERVADNGAGAALSAQTDKPATTVSDSTTANVQRSLRCIVTIIVNTDGETELRTDSERPQTIDES